jgi:serine/threonine-protein kinase
VALAPGTRFGPYEISAQIGEGGMGEVYRATDTTLPRQVAIKVLPAGVASDPDRLARFDREARTLATLNHPNIAAIYGVERGAGALAIVMELVEGPTLADRIEPGPIPVDDALAIARQIADALEAAHEQGIVHRDLKPANIKLSRNGTVKVLDFGLAKTMTPAVAPTLSSAVPTVTSSGRTEVGTVLGTTAYMSPEQAKGLAVDQRGDVWAFACVLYEMLTGRRAFSGTTTADTIAAILERDVDWSYLPASTPASVRTLLRRALAKDPRRRLHHIADARLELEDAHATPTGDTTESRRVLWLWIAIATVALFAMVVSAWRLSSASPPAVTSPMARLSFVPEPPLSTDAIGVLAMSPGGEHIAYVAGKENQIYVRDIDRFDARALPGTDDADMLAFSPDGQWIAFQANSKVKKVALAGGAPIIVADTAEGRGIGWESNESLLFGPGRVTAIWRVSASGGAPQAVTKVQPGENSESQPEGLPGGQAILYRADSITTHQIYAQSLVTGQPHFIDRGSNPHYLRSGHIAYVQDGTLVVAPFDLARLEKTGRQTVVATDLREMGNGTAQVAVSQTGSFAYVPAASGGRRNTLVWVDASGAEQPTTMTGEPFLMPRLSPDLQRLVVHLGSATAPQGGGEDLWMYDLASNRRSRLSFDGASTFPLWEPGGGSRLIVSSRQSGGSFQVLMKTLDGTAPDTPIVSERGTNYPLSWSPDGRLVAIVSVDPDTATDIWLVTLGASPTWRPFVQTRFREGAPTFSSGGQLIAYVSDQTGRAEIYVKPVAGGVDVPVSIDGGTEPLFARGVPTLFYRHGDEMLAVDVTAGPPITVGTPRVVFKRAYERSDGVWPNYDVTPDGRRLLMIRSTAQEAPSRVNVVLNWLDDLKPVATSK